MSAAEVLGPLFVLAAVYCAGGLHGLWLAWSQERRMHKWAGEVVRLNEEGKNR